MKRTNRKNCKSAFVLIPLIVLVCALTYVISLRVNANDIGTAMGASMGSLVGKAVGSLEGMTIGSKEGWDAGKDKGLSAEDTTGSIANELKQLNKLEVLVASVKLNDVHSVGDDYKAIYLLKGEVVFTVDLSKAIIEESDGTLHITLPEPEMEPIIDNNRTEKIAEYQKRFYSGSAEDGLDAYLNSMAKFEEVTKDTLANYDALSESAKNAAKNQVTQLANSVAVNKKNVKIDFMEVNGNEQ